MKIGNLKNKHGDLQSWEYAGHMYVYIYIHIYIKGCNYRCST